MTHLQDDVTAFVWWLEANASESVANLCAGGKCRAMLHRARRTHVYPTKSGKVHALIYPKGCTRDPKVVQRWVRENSFGVEFCPD